MIIDFHAHILPEVDHGCKDVSEALEQMKLAREEGVDYIVATSHFYPHSDTVHSFLAKREQGYQKLMEAKKETLPKILLGAEVLVCKGMEKMEDLELLCVQGTDIMLLELPSGGKWDADLIETIFNIEDQRNIRVVLAHVERYPYEDVIKVIRKGICAQINTSFIAGFGRKPILKQCLKQRSLVAIGSDIHGVKLGYRSFHKARKKLGLQKTTEIMNKTARLLQLNLL